jgi:hypothetical protein
VRFKVGDKCKTSLSVLCEVVIEDILTTPDEKCYILRNVSDGKKYYYSQETFERHYVIITPLEQLL